MLDARVAFFSMHNLRCFFLMFLCEKNQFNLSGTKRSLFPAAELYGKLQRGRKCQNV